MKAGSVELGMLAHMFKTSRFKAVTRTGLGLFLACTVATACECSRKSDPAPTAGEEPADDEATAATAAQPQSIDERLAAVAANCSIDTQTGVISRCKNNEKQGLVRDINTGKVRRAEAFPILVNALASDGVNDEQKQRSVVASKMLESAFRNSWGDKPEQVATKEVAKKLLDTLPRLPARQATQAIPSAVHAAMLTGQQQELYTVLDALPSVELRSSGYSFVLRYGTLAELPKLKTLIEGKEELVATSAVEALRRIPSPSDEQKGQICDFLQSLSADPRPVVAGKIAAQLVNCGGAAVDKLLTQAEAQLKKGDVPASLVRAFDLLCLTRAGKVLGTEAQCKRERVWLETVVASGKVNTEARQAALLGLGLQFPDENTEKLATKYANSDNSDLKAVAQRVVRNVTSKRERAKTNPAGSAPAVSGSPSGTVTSGESKPAAIKPQAIKPGAGTGATPQ